MFQKQNLTINHLSTFATRRYLDFGKQYSSKVSHVIDDNPIAYEWNTRLMVSTSPSPLPSLHPSSSPPHNTPPTHANSRPLANTLGIHFPMNNNRSTLPLALVYSDICVLPITPTSIGNARYFITFTDELTGYC
jgi:hypothetical protein